MPKPLDGERIRRDFRACVNLSADELEAWLATSESRRVGFKRDGGESVGHASGRRILALLRVCADSSDEADLAFMRKVVGFVRRHRAQEPANMVTSRWRYSLMNWGHDPLKG
jgi:predicted NAD/FAD-dependent oxidoreductase